MLSIANSRQDVAIVDLEPLTKKGIEIAFDCDPMALYEVCFRLKAGRGERFNAALVQFLSATGRNIVDAHVTPSVSAKLGRYSYLSSDPNTGVGVFVFFAPNRRRMRLRFCRWASNGPLLLGQAISIHRLTGWSIDTTPGNSEVVRLTATPRPLSVAIPPGASGVIRLSLSSPKHLGMIVVHASSALRLAGDGLRLDDGHPAQTELSALSPAKEILLHVENAGRQTATLALSCVRANFINLAGPVTVAFEGYPQGLPPVQAPLPEPSSEDFPPIWEALARLKRWVLDTLFLHSIVRASASDIRQTAKLVTSMQKDIASTLSLLEGRMQNVAARMDAYAAAEDARDVILDEMLKRLAADFEARLSITEENLAANLDSLVLELQDLRTVLAGGDDSVAPSVEDIAGADEREVGEAEPVARTPESLETGG